MNPFHDVNTLIWDWNGTLLDDTDICVESMNEMLAARGRHTISRQHYRQIFTFPVKDYYVKLGYDFSKENWDSVAIEFMDKYFEKFKQAKLHDHAYIAVSEMDKRGFRQVVLSAMERKSLINSIEEKGLFRFFDHISGIQDHFAHSKLDIAGDILTRYNLPASEVCIIGDTMHDYEVAQKLNCRCILIANGHQDSRRLSGIEAPVLPDILNLLEILH